MHRVLCDYTCSIASKLTRRSAINNICINGKRRIYEDAKVSADTWLNLREDTANPFSSFSSLNECTQYPGRCIIRHSNDSLHTFIECISYQASYIYRMFQTLVANRFVIHLLRCKNMRYPHYECLCKFYIQK